LKETADYYYAHDLGGLPLLNANYKQQNFSKHVHEEYCIGVIDQGAQRFFHNGAEHVAPQHGIILVNPDQVHDGCADNDSGWKYRAIYPMPGLIKNVQDQLSSKNTGTAMFNQSVINDLLLANQLRHLFYLLQYSANTLAREITFMTVMSNLLQRHAGGSNQPLTLTQCVPSIKLIKEYLDCHFADNVSIKTLASWVNLNPNYITRLFQKQIGIPPHAYQIQRRLFHAKKMLLADNTLLNTALSCGFSDQSHLNRHFKRWLGISPGKFQPNIKSSRS
jgi:AraC-like DNA-binding protein